MGDNKLNFAKQITYKYYTPLFKELQRLTIKDLITFNLIVAVMIY